MTDIPTSLADLDKRFTEPPGWRWHGFTRGKRRIRFGSVFPQDSIPDAVVVCLPGLSEFGEKYYEVARTCLEHNLAFWVIDWMGQGGSERYFKNRHKRHSANFQEDVLDLDYFVKEYIKHSSVHPDKGRIPLVMLGHSMGANIGLHYLNNYESSFECAAFSAPMVGMKVFEKNTPLLIRIASAFLGFMMGHNYIPGGGNYNPDKQPPTGDFALTEDPTRAVIQKLWFEHNPDLQVGSPTFRWLSKAHSACLRLQNKKLTQNVKTPCLFALAGKDHLVDNKKARECAADINGAKVIEFDTARHEILMERDEIRDAFFKSFYTLVKENIIDRPETLKPF